MSKKQKTFHPLTHENLDIKNELLNMARKASTVNGDDALTSRLASVLIYSNITEYLAQNLLDNLTYYAKHGTYQYFAGILFVEKMSEQSSERMTLGTIISELKKFNFPDKMEIIDDFEKISKSRNRIFHNFGKSDLDTILQMLKDDLPLIVEKCEEVINKVNTIYLGLGKILAQDNAQQGTEK